MKAFTPEQTREIVFKTMLEAEIDHTVLLDGSGPADYRSVVAFFARQLLKDMHLVGGYDLLYPKVRDFIRDHLFVRVVDLQDPVILRNLSEPEAGKLLFDNFRKAINALTIRDAGSSRIEGHIRLRDTRPFSTEARDFVPAKRSVFNRIVGEVNAGGLELDFAAVPGTRAGRSGIRQELHGGGVPAGLRARQRRSVELHAGFHRAHDGWRGMDRRDQGPRGTRRAAEDGASASMVRRCDRG